MDLLAFIGGAGRWLLRALLVIAPLLAWQWTITLGQPYRAKTGAIGPTLVASTMVGLGALVALLPGTTLTWDAIVTSGGFWDLTVPEFLAVSVDIVRQALPALLATLRFDDERRNVQSWIAAALALWFIRLAIGLIAGPPRGGSQFLLAEIAGFVIGVFATIYAGPLLMWSVNRLNFWIFLVLILLIQDFRYCDPPLTVRLLGRLTRLPQRQPRAPGPMP